MNKKKLMAKGLLIFSVSFLTIIFIVLIISFAQKTINHFGFRPKIKAKVVFLSDGQYFLKNLYNDQKASLFEREIKIDQNIWHYYHPVAFLSDCSKLIFQKDIIDYKESPEGYPKEEKLFLVDESGKVSELNNPQQFRTSTRDFVLEIQPNKENYLTLSPSGKYEIKIENGPSTEPKYEGGQTSYGGVSYLKLIELKTGKEKTIYSWDRIYLTEGEWQPEFFWVKDQEAIYFLGLKKEKLDNFKGTLFKYDIKKDKNEEIINNLSISPYYSILDEVSVSPDGKYFVYISSDKQVNLVELSTKNSYILKLREKPETRYYFYWYRNSQKLIAINHYYGDFKDRSAAWIIDSKSKNIERMKIEPIGMDQTTGNSWSPNNRYYLGKKFVRCENCEDILHRINYFSLVLVDTKTGLYFPIEKNEEKYGIFGYTCWF